MTNRRAKGGGGVRGGEGGPVRDTWWVRDPATGRARVKRIYEPGNLDHVAGAALRRLRAAWRPWAGVSFVVALAAGAGLFLRVFGLDLFLAGPWWVPLAGSVLVVLGALGGAVATRLEELAARARS